MQPAADFKRILGALCGAEVQFIIVGGVSAVLHGAPISTFDLDIVHQRDDANVRRLLAALGELRAVYRAQFGRKIEPTASVLSGAGHNLLLTDAGPLDVLGTIGQQLSYEDLLPFTSELPLVGERKVRVLGLAKLIEIKEKLGTPKDLAVLPVLKRTLSENGSQ